MSDERDRTDEEPGFTVTDRRGVDRDVDGDGEDGQQPAGADGGSGDAAAAQGGEERPLPDIDFSTFVLSLSTSAMIHLGEAETPDGGKQVDLQLAKQTIDILGILRDKTRGNLTEDEDKLLGGLLYDLRVRYVTKASS